MSFSFQRKFECRSLIFWTLTEDSSPSESYYSLVHGDTMSITTSSILPAPVQQSFSYKLLSVPVPNMIHKIPAMKKQMPRNGGRILRMRRYNALNTAMVPLGNSGVTPPAQLLTAVDIDAEISFYGTYIYINEQVTLQSQDPVLNEAAARLGVSLRYAN